MTGNAPAQPAAAAAIPDPKIRPNYDFMQGKDEDDQLYYDRLQKLVDQEAARQLLAYPPPRQLKAGDTIPFEFNKLPTELHDAAHNITKYKGTALPEYVDRRGLKHERKVDFTPGMRDLARVVAGFQKGVKQVNGTQTKAAADNWIERNKKKGWIAMEEDITGKHGTPDGIKEVLIIDNHGNVRIINGYTTTSSDYLWKNQWMTAYPNEIDRKQHPLSEYKAQFRTLKAEPSGTDGTYEWEKDIPIKLQRFRKNTKSAKVSYKKLFFSPTYKQFAKFIKSLPYETIGKSKLNSTVFKFCWRLLFEYPAIKEEFSTYSDADLTNMANEDYKKLVKNSKIQARAKSIYDTILQDNDMKLELYIQTASIVYRVMYDLGVGEKGDLPSHVYGVKAQDLYDYDDLLVALVNDKATIEAGFNQYQTAAAQAEAKRINDFRNTAVSKYNERNAARNRWKLHQYADDNSLYDEIQTMFNNNPDPYVIATKDARYKLLNPDDSTPQSPAPNGQGNQESAPLSDPELIDDDSSEDELIPLPPHITQDTKLSEQSKNFLQQLSSVLINNYEVYYQKETTDFEKQCAILFTIVELGNGTRSNDIIEDPKIIEFHNQLNAYDGLLKIDTRIRLSDAFVNTPYKPEMLRKIKSIMSDINNRQAFKNVKNSVEILTEDIAAQLEANDGDETKVSVSGETYVANILSRAIHKTQQEEGNP